jgi:hypothetical protein
LINFNPLVDSFDGLSDAQLETTIRDLSRKYFQTRNPQVQIQIASILDMYKEEFRARLAKKNSNISSNPDLDNLINIS